MRREIPVSTLAYDLQAQELDPHHTPQANKIQGIKVQLFAAKREKDDLEWAVKMCLHDDQIQVLKEGSLHGSMWHAEIIKNAPICQSEL